MLRLWRKKDSSVKEVFVPVILTGNKNYYEKWQDDNCLRHRIDIGSNEVFVDEVVNCLKNVRDLADNAETPEELKGYRNAIREIKGLLTLSERAKVVLSEKRISEDGCKDEKGLEMG